MNLTTIMSNCTPDKQKKSARALETFGHLRYKKGAAVRLLQNFFLDK